MKNTFTVILVLLVFFGKSFAQSKIDSLEQQLDSTTGADKAKTYNELFKIYLNTDPSEALENATLALETAAEAKDDKGMAASLNNLGIVYKNQGIYDKSLDYYIRALRIAKKIGDPYVMASIMSNIGTVYSLMGINDKALIYYIEAYDKFDKLNELPQLRALLNNIGNAYFDNGREDKALEYYSEALKKSEMLADHSANFDPLNNMGNILYTTGDYQEALNYYTQAYQISVNNRNKFNQALAAANIGITYNQLEKADSAEVQLMDALMIAKQIDDNLVLKNVYGALQKMYYDQEKYKEAYDAKVLEDQYEDRLHNEESARRIMQMEAALRLEEKEGEILVLRKQTEIDKLILENNRIVIMIALIGMILLIAIGFIIYSLKKDKQNKFYRWTDKKRSSS